MAEEMVVLPLHMVRHLLPSYSPLSPNYDRIQHDSLKNIQIEAKHRREIGQSKNLNENVAFTHMEEESIPLHSSKPVSEPPIIAHDHLTPEKNSIMSIKTENEVTPQTVKTLLKDEIHTENQQFDDSGKSIDISFRTPQTSVKSEIKSPQTFVKSEIKSPQTSTPLSKSEELTSYQKKYWDLIEANSFDGSKIIHPVKRIPVENTDKEKLKRFLFIGGRQPQGTIHLVEHVKHLNIDPEFLSRKFREILITRSPISTRGHMGKGLQRKKWIQIRW